MADRVVTVPDSLEIPADVKVPSGRLSDSTAAGRALLAGADAAAQRASLGLGTAATHAHGDYATAAQGATADAAATALAGRLSEASLSSTYGTLGTDTDLVPVVQTTVGKVRVLTPEAGDAKIVAGVPLIVVPASVIELPDATAAIAAIITAAPAGSRVQLPMGTIKATISLTKRIHLFGHGPRSTIIQPPTTAAAIKVIDVAHSTRSEGGSVINLGIDCTAAPNGVGISIANTEHGVIQDVWVNRGSIGIQVQDSGFTSIERSTISDQSLHGIYLPCDGGAEHRFRHLHVFRTTASGSTTGTLIKATRTTATDGGGLYFEGLVAKAHTTLDAGIDIDCASPNTVMPIFFNNTVSDGIFGGWSVKITNVVDVQAVNSWFTVHDGAAGALLLTGGRWLKFTSSRLVGGTGPAVKLAGTISRPTFIANNMSGSCGISFDAAATITELAASGNQLIGGIPLTDDSTTFIAAMGANEASAISVYTNGAGGAVQTFRLVGSGGKKKHLRVTAGSVLEFLSDAFAVIATLSDTGLLWITGGLKVTGKILKAGSSPTIAAQAGAGSTPPTPTLLRATDMGGTAQWGTGSSPAAGTQVRVTFTSAYTNPPTVILSPANAATAALHPFVTQVTIGYMDIQVAIAPAATQPADTYAVNWVAFDN